MHEGRSTVAHFVPIYLPLTGSWIYNQICHLVNWRPVVLSYRLENLALFPFDAIYARQSLTKPAQIYQRMMKFVYGYPPFFKDVIKKEGAAVLHAHFGQNGFSCISLAKAAQVPLVTTFYGFDLSQLPKIEPEWVKRYQELFAFGALFLVEGPHMKQQLANLGCPPGKVAVQRLGIDIHELPFQQRRPNADGTIRILVSGTFTEKKGIPYALEAFARVFRQHRNLRLTVIGDARPNYPDEQAIKQTLLEIIKLEGLDAHVDFWGYQPHPVLIEAFYSHHILISPSVQASAGDNEGGSPVTITEASATGMPVLSTFHCDIPEVILNEQSGYLVPERDVDALVQRLEQMVTSPEKWEGMGRAGRAHIEKNFNANTQAHWLEHHYSSLL
jgi:colanic acid/amylovoran biosynthesis glycosyltransferase